MAYQTIDDHLGNWYKAKRCENIENLFNYLDYGFFTRMNISSKPTICLQQSCCCYEFITYPGNRRFTFSLGESFTQLWEGNGICSVTITFEGNKMIEVQRGTKTVFIVREFFDQTMVETITVDHLMARRYYERDESCCIC